ncbi:MAG: polyprenyl synthetase family protein, partial [Hydrogenovibrio sp.]|nr:polyprenyl synthetase family protein [Hydrogenovibrio sp.]
ANYGKHLGAAFQLIDDALDYMADEAELGKNIGDDLAEGKPTLPLIYVLEQGTEQEKNVIRRAIETDGIDLLKEVTEIIQNSGAIDYTIQYAQREVEQAKQAISILEPSQFKTALERLAELAADRTS